MKLNRFAKYAWGVLAVHLLVILWGAYVRATGSGAGCGNHWPLCNGEVVPQSHQIETLIEFTHRLSSGVAFVLVVVLLIWALRANPKGNIVRTGAWLAMFFIATEALIGAGLVIFEWVADDASMGRAFSIAIHLANTFLLLASITLTAWWASGGQPPRLTGQRGVIWALGLGFLGVLLLGVTGAITALGDTLFPSASLAEGLQQDFSASAHFLIRLRVWHPLIAIGVGFYLMLVAAVLGLIRSDGFVKRFALATVVLFILQFGVGITNMLLLAPIPIQLVHLLLADLVWITMVLLAAATLTGVEVSSETPESEQPVRYVETPSAS
jgi:heme A synthase